MLKVAGDFRLALGAFENPASNGHEHTSVIQTSQLYHRNWQFNGKCQKDIKMEFASRVTMRKMPVELSNIWNRGKMVVKHGGSPYCM